MFLNGINRCIKICKVFLLSPRDFLLELMLCPHVKVTFCVKKQGYTDFQHPKYFLISWLYWDLFYNHESDLRPSQTPWLP